MALRAFTLLFNHHHHISRALSSSQTEAWAPLNTTPSAHPLPSSRAPGNRLSTFSVHEFDYFWHFTLGGIRQICAFVNGFFHQVQHPRGSSEWQPAAKCLSFLGLDGILLWADHIVFIHPFNCRWVLDHFQLLAGVNNAAGNMGAHPSA